MTTVLGNMSLAFKDLATATANQDMEVVRFAQACSSITSVAQQLGPIFYFALLDFGVKVAGISEASRSFRTLKSMMEADIQQNNVRTAGSHSSNLLMVKRVIEMVKILFEQIVATNYDDKGDNSLISQGLVAYKMVFTQHNEAELQATVASFSHFIPTKAELLAILEEDEASIIAKMRMFVEAATPISRYINNLFVSRGLGLDW
ncbi:hypothetical protein MKW94_024717 [Papaver nudicaule]|uniref:Glycolipid transfer protein domain-containing protein n=1 Tax=Papaver nudicaule TaxID=74823 RepID=A0AA41SH07_PAPNU|nr:hypothetical protein [Papaver nudicaule]